MVKDNKRIKSALKEFHRRVKTYLKHCNKEKIETISRWCKQLVNHGKNMERNLKGSWNHDHVREKLTHVK